MKTYSKIFMLALAAAFSFVTAVQGDLLTSFEFTGNSLAPTLEADDTSSTNITSGGNVNNTLSFGSTGSGSNGDPTGIFNPVQATL